MTQKRLNLFSLLFLLPFVLAFLSWAYFPLFAQGTIATFFRYVPIEKTANPLWLATISFFYTWYTFLAIGFAGVWIVAAFITRQKHIANWRDFRPMFSFVVPAFNEEANVGRCIRSLYKCAEVYEGNCEIIVIDDGSKDYTYETAWRTVEECKKFGLCRVRSKVVKHMANLGKIEALRTGVNIALGGVVAVVDADSDWRPETLNKLVDGMLVSELKGVTGYIDPKTYDTGDDGLLISLQKLEYSQGLSIDRCGQSMGNHVLVVPGAIGVYDAALLRKVFTDGNIRSVTEDSEITLEIQKRGGRVGYLSAACGSTDAPRSLRVLWRQRLRWFTGWLHNILDIHADLFQKVSWLSTLLWYSFLFEFFGAFVDVAAVVAFPFLFWFAPDHIDFLLNLLVFAAYGLLISVINQTIAIRFAYNDRRHFELLGYTPFYPFLWIVNVFARIRSIVSYARGSNGKWH